MSKQLKAAIEANDPAATQVALKNVKDINRRLPGADTPLHYACQMGADRVLEILVKAGARVPRRFDPLEDPFAMAAERDHVAVLKRMIELGLTFPEQVEEVLSSAAMEGWFNVFEYLLDELKPPITARLFRLAAEAKNRAMIESLIRRGGDINAQEPEKASNPGSTPMHSAAEGGGDPAVLKMLVSCGANPNARDPSGKTPLMTLAEGLANQPTDTATAVLKLLLSLGADARLLDNYGNDALCYYEASLSSRMKPNATIRGAFLRAGAAGLEATGVLFEAIRVGDVRKVAKAIAAGAEVNRISPLRATPLAWSNDSLEITEMLLNAGADPNRGAEQYPLVRAARVGNLAVVKALIANGADINVVEEAGEWRENALTAADRNGNHLVVKYLKSLGAGRPKPTRFALLRPGVGDWQDFSEIVVQADARTVARACAELCGGTVLENAFGKSVVPGDRAWVVARPKGMRWSNVFQITPAQKWPPDEKAEMTFARQLASLAKVPVVLIAYSDTSDAASTIRVLPDGKIQRDAGWDYESLKEMVDSLGSQAPPWAKELLKGTDPDESTSTERLQRLAELEKFAVGHFSIQGEWGSAMDIHFGILAEAVFEEVAFITN